MPLSWLLRPLRHRKRTRLLAEPFPEAWLPILNELPFYRALDERGQQRIRDDLRVLIAENKVTIAAQASLLLMNIEHEFYGNVQSILVYPRAYRTMQRTDAAGV